MVSLGALEAPLAAADTCGNVANVAPRISPDRTTIGATETATVTVTGSNYLLPTHLCGTDVFGGVYVFFGWVRPGGQWGPSWRTSTTSAGLFGQTYSYPGEGGGAEIRDDGTGVVRLVSFTDGGESGDSTGFHMDATGNWTSTLTIRGSTYSYRDIATGNTASVDCLTVQCGVFTIGAHGKSSRTNEQFSPINFTTGGGAVVVPPPAAANAAPGGATGTVTGGSGGGTVRSGASAGTGGSATTTPTTSAPNSGITADESTTAAAPGSVGEAPVAVAGESTVKADDGGDSSATQRASSPRTVQDFGGSSDSGSGWVVGGCIGAAAVVTAGGAVAVRRRRVGTAGGGN